MIESPSGRTPEKVPRWDLTGQKVAMVEKWFRGSLGCYQGIRVYIGKATRSGEPRGAHEGGGRALLIRLQRIYNF